MDVRVRHEEFYQESLFVMIPYGRHSINDEDIAAVIAALKSDWLTTGPLVEAFELGLEKIAGAPCISVSSGTAALHCAYAAIGIEPGDEIIVTPWTMCATATAILHWNAIPVFADIEPDTFNINPASVEANITPYTKAIMAVDIFGHSADVDALMAIAEKHNLKLITDTAQAPGTFYKGRITGTLAHVGGYSLNYHKHIHTGEGRGGPGLQPVQVRYR